MLVGELICSAARRGGQSDRCQASVNVDVVSNAFLQQNGGHTKRLLMKELFM